MSRRDGRAALFVGPLLFALLILFGVLIARRLERRATQAGFGIIETDRIALDLEGAAQGFGTWLDPAWSEMLQNRLASIDHFPADDPKGVAEVMAAMGEFSFIKELGVPRVIWPDGLDVPFRLRRPIACVAFEGRFYGVAIDWEPAGGPRGVLMPGGSLTPPGFAGAFLPVIGGVHGPLESVWLEDPALLGALSVADSMWHQLEPDVAGRLGRIVIDARRDGAASVEEPGVRLQMEGGRTAYFGRSPFRAAAGELPVGDKWKNLVRAIDLAAGGQDWDLVDLRWDQPDIRFSNQPIPEDE